MPRRLIACLGRVLVFSAALIAFGKGTNAQTISTVLSASETLSAFADLVVDRQDNVYVFQGVNGWVRVSPDGAVTPAPATSFTTLFAFDPEGNWYSLSIGAHRVSRRDPSGTTTVIAGTGAAGFSGDGGPAVSATLNGPSRITADDAGNVYIFDGLNNRVRRVGRDGIIRTVVGNGALGIPVDGAVATETPLEVIWAMATARDGRLFMASHWGGTGLNPVYRPRVWVLDRDGRLRRYAGTGTTGFRGDGGPARDAELMGAISIATDPWGYLYIAEGQTLTGEEGRRVRVVRPDGIISTAAGTSEAGFAGDGGPATSALLHRPTAVGVDSAGNLLIADNVNRRLRKVTYAPQRAALPLIARAAQAADGSRLAASGSFLSLYGRQLAATTTTWDQAISGDRLPTDLAGVKVRLDGRECAISYVSPGQVNVLLPLELLSSARDAVLEVETSAGVSKTLVRLVPAQPAWFTYARGGVVTPTILFVGEYTFVGPAGSIPGAESRPAAPGDYLVGYISGLGATATIPPYAQTLTQSYMLQRPDSVKLRLAGREVPLLFVGLVLPGLYQVNFQAPSGLTPGEVSIEIEVDNIRSQTGLTLTIAP